MIADDLKGRHQIAHTQTYHCSPVFVEALNPAMQYLTQSSA